MMVRVLDEGDYLVPGEQGERLRQRLSDADALPLEERNAAVRELIAEVKRDGTEAPKGLTPDLVLTLVSPPPQPAPPAEPEPPPDDGTHYYRDPADPRYEPDSQGGPPGQSYQRPPGKTYGEVGRDIDPTDPWRG